MIMAWALLWVFEFGLVVLAAACDMTVPASMPFFAPESFLGRLGPEIEPERAPADPDAVAAFVAKLPFGRNQSAIRDSLLAVGGRSR